jgi:hypothetical protein
MIYQKPAQILRVFDLHVKLTLRATLLIATMLMPEAGIAQDGSDRYGYGFGTPETRSIPSGPYRREPTCDLQDPNTTMASCNTYFNSRKADLNILEKYKQDLPTDFYLKQRRYLQDEIRRAARTSAIISGEPKNNTAIPRISPDSYLFTPDAVQTRENPTWAGIVSTGPDCAVTAVYPDHGSSCAFIKITGIIQVPTPVAQATPQCIPPYNFGQQSGIWLGIGGFINSEHLVQAGVIVNYICSAPPPSNISAYVFHEYTGSEPVVHGFLVYPGDVVTVSVALACKVNQTTMAYEGKFIYDIVDKTPQHMNELHSDTNVPHCPTSSAEAIVERACYPAGFHPVIGRCDPMIEPDNDYFIFSDVMYDYLEDVDQPPPYTVHTDIGNGATGSFPTTPTYRNLNSDGCDKAQFDASYMPGMPLVYYTFGGQLRVCVEQHSTAD